MILVLQLITNQKHKTLETVTSDIERHIRLTFDPNVKFTEPDRHFWTETQTEANIRTVYTFQRLPSAHLDSDQLEKICVQPK